MMYNNNMDEKCLCIYDNVGQAFAARVKDASLVAPLTLAYVGDTIYDLFVRSYLVSASDYTVTKLHSLAVKTVCAKAQAEAFRRVEGMLTEQELSIYKRGKNTHSSVPKSASPGDYRTATGFEALLGWLYLSGNDERLSEIMRTALNTNNN